MHNKRKSARIKLRNRIEVYDAQSNELLGIMVDISAGGFKILTKNQMEQGKEYLLSIVLPVGNSGRKIVFKADVRWCGKDIKHNLLAAGCYLVQINSKDKLGLTVLMLNELMPHDDGHAGMSELSFQNGKV